MFQFCKLWAAQSKHPALVCKEKKLWHCINSLQCFAHWGWTGAEGVDGCPGPTAAWHRGTENPSVWGTLHLYAQHTQPLTWGSLLFFPPKQSRSVQTAAALPKHNTWQQHTSKYAERRSHYGSDNIPIGLHERCMHLEPLRWKQLSSQDWKIATVF